MSGVPAVTSPILNVIEMGDQLARYLALCSDHLLQANNLIYQYFVGLGELKILLLQSLDLVLCCCKRLAQNDDLLRCWERVLCLRRFSRSGCLPPDVVEVVFPIGPEFWMSEFPSVASIWRIATLFVMPNFMEVIFVKLTDEARKVAVLEVFWEDGFGELLVLLGC